LKACRFLDTDARGIQLRTTVETRAVEAIALPIGIVPAEFAKQGSQFEKHLQCLKKEFKDYRLILGVDRIDYTKGLPEKLRIFDRFLRTHLEYKGKVVLIQIGIPSRESLPETKRLLAEVCSLVGEINSKHGEPKPRPKLEWQLLKPNSQDLSITRPFAFSTSLLTNAI
jgi:trehalose 6-phosphate synthase